MTIESGDIVFLASETMTDDDEGGGAPSSTEIEDGVSNAIFPDISEVDRAGGKFRLRKLFMAVKTATTDTFGGANVIISAVPSDDNVSVTMLQADDYFEERADAVDRVENYLYRSSLFAGFLIEDHLAGMQSLQIAQRPGATLPSVGETLFLVGDEGATGEYSQYVRVKSVSSETVTYTDSLSSGSYVDYDVQVVDVELTSALEYDFPGTAVNRTFTTDSSAAKIRTTIVANATDYYGASALTAAVASGDTACTVSSIYSRIVPAAQSESALTDVSAMGSTTPVVAAASGTVSRSVSISAISSGGAYILPTACYPGTLSVVTPSGTLTDDGAGTVLLNYSEAGTIDYSTGTIDLTVAISSGTCTETYQPGAAVSQQSYTEALEVTSETRSLVWVDSLTPIPTPGTLTVSYMSGGNWYTLTDDGSGKLSGTDSSYGVGQIKFTTGTLSLTLGALPDVGTYILMAWGTGSENVLLTTSALSISSPEIEFDVGEAISAGTLTITWTADGVTQTATDDGSGSLSGDATGVVYYGSGTGYLIPTLLPDSGTIAMAYSKGTSESYGTTTSGGTTWTGTLGTEAIKPGTVVGTLLLAWSSSDADDSGYSAVSGGTTSGTVRDDGDGGFTLDGYGALTGSSIDYDTGAVVLVINYQSTTPVATYTTVTVKTALTQTVLSGYSVDTATREIAEGGISWKWRLASDTDSTGSSEINEPSMTLDLQPYLAGTIVSGSLLFKIGSYEYIDRSGVLYHSIDPATGSGTEAGTIAYASGKAEITSWPSGTFSFSLLAGLITPGGTGMSYVFNHTSESPIKTQSFQITGTTLDGDAISVTADSDGTISGDLVTGSIDYDTGIFDLEFGQTVDGTWTAVLVDPSSLTYNAVAYSYLPLDSSIIGIDPVRLPTDGKVVIFKAGNYTVLGHTESVSKTVAAGDTVDLGRTRLSRVWIVDADSNKVSTGYTTDLDAGTVTFTDVTDYVQPVTIYDRIEDMAMISDAQISGDITFTREISHAYPVGAVLSTALVLGDQYAHMSNFFDQESWDGSTWADSVDGDNATATYDKTTYPLGLTNAGAVTESWCIRFTSTTAFQIIGEHLGILGTGTTSANVEPDNPNSDEPYFSLDYRGWGEGWAAGNCLFFQTVSAKPPFWLAETIQQGTETSTEHSLTLIARGDVDAD